MNYEVVELEAKIVAGIVARTNNQSADMPLIIGELWKQFYQEGIFAAISTKKSQKPMGIYTDYERDEKADYSVMVACEVDQGEGFPKDIVVKQLPAGKFAKFIVTGNLHEAIHEFWINLWDLNLERTYLYDFEEYQDSHIEDTEIHIYIGIK